MATTDIFNLGNMAQSTDWTVDPKTQTVAGQLNSVIASDSPIMQQARARAVQTMNSRGLSNSSMAVGAADSAVYDQALKIATPDAATFADAAKTNAGVKNTFNLQNNSLTGQTNAQNWGAQQDFGRQTARDATQQGFTQANMKLAQTNDLDKLKVNQGYTQSNINLNQTNDLAKLKANQGYTLDQLAAQSGYDIKKLGVQAEAAKDVADIEATYKNITQGSQSATQILNKMQDSLNVLMANKDITDATKRDAMAADIKANAAEALNLVGAMATDLDLSSYIDSIGL